MKKEAKFSGAKLLIGVSRASFLIISVALILITARFALADYYYSRAKATLDTLDIDRLEYSYKFKPVIDDIERALKLRKTADFLDFRGDLAYQSWWLSPDGQYFPDSDLLQKAVENHLEALELRQGWSYSTARLALIYSNQAVLDENFEYWFTEAHRLGLYETSIAYSLMVVGLRNWERLNPKLRALTLDFVHTSIEQKSNSPKRLKIVLETFGKHEFVCSTISDTWRKNQVCE
ncbi:MAG: hypothetical protein KTR16_01765 [Acidiferrobacterales bacterium]|nr:hypothetical protein [Acidiferrobacterales bacterium]